MFLVASNKARRLLHVSYIGRVTAADLKRGYEDVAALLADLPSGFTTLVDLDRLKSMDMDCVDELGRIMELLDQRGQGQVVRVIPDPAKDIGLNIIARFHYHHNLRTINCETMVEAAKILSL
jgi:hypothetical protein